MQIGYSIGFTALFLTVAVVDASDRPTFDGEIAPLLKRHCVKCHGPAKQEGKLNLAAAGGLVRGGTAGAAIVPHDVEGSAIWQRISADEMPPESPLSQEDKALLRRWITEGTPGLSVASSDPSDHWSFQPLAGVAVPDVKTDGKHATDSVATPVDRFLLSRLAEVKLSYLPEADRLMQIRRVSFDLTGLPPTVDAINDFVSDASDDAYARMVERYLASPHFGERIGKLWLDAGGYADSNGYFNADSDRPLAHRYRDYVIRSLNEDKPFDRFVREQIAGDEIARVKMRLGEPVDLPQTWQHDPTQARRLIELLEATHYLRNGQDGTGESDGNPDEVRVDRYTVLETTMQNISTGLLGLTIQCAKCHDHKFEPLTQRDYYGFQAVLIPSFPPEQWVKPNDRIVYATLPGETEKWQSQLKDVTEEVTRLQAEIGPWVRANRPHGKMLFDDAFDGSPDELVSKWSNTAPGDDKPAGTAVVNLNSREAPAAIVADGRLQLIEGGPGGDKWLCTKEAFDWAPEGVGAAIQVTFDLIANQVGSSSPAERIGYLIALHDFDNNSATAGGNVLIDGHPSMGTAVYLDYPGGGSSNSLGTVGKTGYAAGRNYGVRITNLGKGKFQLQQLVDWIPEEPAIKLSKEDLPRGGFGFEFCCGRSFVVDNVVVESFTPQDGVDPLAEFKKELAVRRKSLDEAIKQKEQLTNGRPGKVALTTEVVEKAPAVHVLERGNYATPGQPVEPSGFSVLGSQAASALAPEIPVDGRMLATSGRRLEFANWLTAPNSKTASLMARVQVNRLWQHHFGTGLVATADNFGLSGPPPSNRELLDWLAFQFTQSGWSVKHVVRLIVNSNAYRQGSQVLQPVDVADADKQPDRWRLDPDGRMLSRFPIRRLDAEAIRDQLLAASDDFDDRLYGSYVPTSRTGNGETVVPEDSSGLRRRSIYLQQKRTQVHSLLQVFDAPSIVFNSTRRARSTMPLQSLSLLNSEFVVKRGRHLAEVLERTQSSDSDRLTSAFLRTTGRPPTDDDVTIATKFLQSQRDEYRDQPDAAAKSWSDFCQMMLVGNSALYLE